MGIKTFRFYIVALAMLAASCQGSADKENKPPAAGDSLSAIKSYKGDHDFLKKYTQHVLELKSHDSGARVLLCADYQGRVMTSTATGEEGHGFGWINYSLIASREKKKQFNPVGGEERFWLGPEGGQYSLYFKKGDSFNIANWQVPSVIDKDTYDIAAFNDTQALFTRKASLVNYSGTIFDLLIERKISLLDKHRIEEKLQMTIPASVHFVGYETDNSITNTGSKDWKKENGLLSIWLLGMMTPSEATKVIIPFLPRKNIHDYITDNYFGVISPDRLQIRDSILFFTCDGKSRGKIGLSPVIAKSIAGSFDFKNNVLSLIFFPVDREGLYVNSKWELQQQPFKGDVVNSYNDGPLPDGSQMGPFYEIESSSSVKELKKGERQQYKQVTCHFQGDFESLNAIAKHLLGISLDVVK